MCRRPLCAHLHADLAARALSARKHTSNAPPSERLAPRDWRAASPRPQISAGRLALDGVIYWNSCASPQESLCACAISLNKLPALGRQWAQLAAEQKPPRDSGCSLAKPVSSSPPNSLGDSTRASLRSLGPEQSGLSVELRASELVGRKGKKLAKEVEKFGALIWGRRVACS